MLSEEQVSTLLRPINPRRVLVAQGQSHLPAFDVEAHLSRIFGFDGWDKEILDLWLIKEDCVVKVKDGRERGGWYVTYGCKLRLHIHNAAYRDGVATGSAQNMPFVGDAHDFAIKNADSYALKRAAKSWGDQFGLSLYNKGSTEALVKRVVGFGVSNDPVDKGVQEPQSMGHDEGGGDWVDRELTGDMATQAQIAKLHASLPDNIDVHAFCGEVLMIQVDSLKHLTKQQMSKCIEAAA